MSIVFPLIQYIWVRPLWTPPYLVVDRYPPGILTLTGWHIIWKYIKGHIIKYNGEVFVTSVNVFQSIFTSSTLLFLPLLLDRNEAIHHPVSQQLIPPLPLLVDPNNEVNIVVSIILLSTWWYYLIQYGLNYSSGAVFIGDDGVGLL